MNINIPLKSQINFSHPLVQDIWYGVKILSLVLAYPSFLLIKIYQLTISPDHSLLKIFSPLGFCKFYPSCSQFTALVLRTEGLLGLPKILKRLISCNPKSFGGVDLPPHHGK